MKIQVIDCNYLFTDCLIEEAKHDMSCYRQGFMVVDDKLYMPYYKVLKNNYTLPNHYKTTVIDLDDVTKYDSMSTYFNKVDALDIDDIIDLYDECYDVCHNDCSFDKILDLVDEIAQAKYDLGYNDGYDVGNEDGYSSGYTIGGGSWKPLD